MLVKANFVELLISRYRRSLSAFYRKGRDKNFPEKIFKSRRKRQVSEVGNLTLRG